MRGLIYAREEPRAFDDTCGIAFVYIPCNWKYHNIVKTVHGFKSLKPDLSTNIQFNTKALVGEK